MLEFRYHSTAGCKLAGFRAAHYSQLTATHSLEGVLLAGFTGPPLPFPLGTPRNYVGRMNSGEHARLSMSPCGHFIVRWWADNQRVTEWRVYER